MLQKLEKLILISKPNFIKARLHNFTTLEIQPEIQSILKMEKNYCVGGSFRESNNYVKIQNIFLKFREYCRKNDINKSINENVRCHSVVITQDLETTRPYDERIGKLINFMQEINQIVIVNVEKSVHVAADMGCFHW